MLSAKSIQRLYKPSRSRLLNIPAVKKLQTFRSHQTTSESSADDTNLSRDQVIEIYDWISQINSEFN